MRRVLSNYITHESSPQKTVFRVNIEGAWRQFEADSYSDLREALKTAGIFRETVHNLIYESKTKQKIVLDCQEKLNRVATECELEPVLLTVSPKPKSLMQLPPEVPKQLEAQQSLFPLQPQQPRTDALTQAVNLWLTS